MTRDDINHKCWTVRQATTTQKMIFSIKDFFSKCDQIRMVTFTGEILDGKLHFLCSVHENVTCFIFLEDMNISDAVRDLAPFAQFKNVKNAHGGVLLSVKLQALA